MFLELLRKEFIKRKNDEKQSLAMSILSIFLRLLLLSAFIGLECYIALSLDKKIVQYSSYGSFDFLVLSLFVLMALDIVFSMLKARKSIFDHEDSLVTLPLPISPSTQVLSKIVYIYIESVVFVLFTSTPLLICYGARRGFIPYYYIFSCLYPILISFFAVGLSLILSIGYQQIYKLIKKSDIAQFVSASIIVISLCFLYQFVLNLFLTALNDSSIGGVFSMDFVNSLHQARTFFLPVYYLLDSVIEQTRIASDILIFIGASLLSLVVGIAVASVSYFHDIKQGDYQSKKEKKKTKKILLASPLKMLIKKEMDLLFKDEANLFSYTSLLILCPFLTFAVISSLNSIIYDNLRFYSSYFPELVSGINLALILLFAGVINASASSSMSREGKALIIVKYLPISPWKQILAKTLIPIVFSFLSLLVTDIVLISTGVITLPVFFTSLFIGMILLIFSNVFGIYCDMHDKEGENRKIKLSFFNEAIPLILPILIFGLFFLLSIYTSLPSWALYLFASLFSFLVLLPIFIFPKKRFEKAFIKMEVSN